VRLDGLKFTCTPKDAQASGMAHHYEQCRTAAPAVTAILKRYRIPHVAGPVDEELLTSLFLFYGYPVLPEVYASFVVPYGGSGANRRFICVLSGGINLKMTFDSVFPNLDRKRNLDSKY
jgi:hypothetical protein